MVGIHLCAGEVQNMALFTKAAGCEKEKNLPPCHKHESAPCCDDETIILKGKDFKASIAHITISSAPVLDFKLPVVIISEAIPSAPISRTQCYHYDPPLRSYDLTVSHQVFLI